MFGWLGKIVSRITRDQRRPATARISQSSRTLAGVPITPDTAMKIATVWACIRYLSQTVAVLPWHVMYDGAKGAEVKDSHPVDWLVYKRANVEWSSFQFRETLLHWALRYGNGYAEIERDTSGRPIALWPIHPERVIVCRDEAGAIYYEVSNGTEAKTEIPSQDMFHLRGFGESVVGVNVIQYAAESLGWASAVQLYGAAFFGNGANVATVVQNKTALTPEALKLQKAEFVQLYTGPRRAHKTAHIDNDAKIERVGLNAQESQLIEVHQHLIEEVCRWFNVPPHKVAHLLRATFSNIEHQAIEVVVDAVSPWVKRFEDEADCKLFGQNRSNFYTKMNMRALMRGDAVTRVQYYEGMSRIGAYSPNRVLELEDENTIGPDGDIHTMQSQNVTLKTIREGPPAPVLAPKQPTTPAQARLAAKLERVNV